MDARLLTNLVCPRCKGPLHHNSAQRVLICKADRLSFPIRDDIPVMLESEASPWTPDSTSPQHAQ